MSFRFITSILSAGALIATVSAAPAKAGEHDELGIFLGTAATLFIIGSLIDNKDSKATVSTRSSPQHQVVKPRRATPVVTPNRAKPVVTPRRVPLPRQCLIRVDGGGTKYALAKRCVDRNYHSANRLPGGCKVTLRGARADRPAYSMNCLRKRGYTVAKR